MKRFIAIALFALIAVATTTPSFARDNRKEVGRPAMQSVQQYFDAHPEATLREAVMAIAASMTEGKSPLEVDAELGEYHLDRDGQEAKDLEFNRAWAIVYGLKKGKTFDNYDGPSLPPSN